MAMMRVHARVLLKKWLGAPLPHGRGSVTGCRASGVFPSRAREQAVFRFLQQPASVLFGVRLDNRSLTVAAQNRHFGDARVRKPPMSLRDIGEKFGMLGPRGFAKSPQPRQRAHGNAG